MDKLQNIPVVDALGFLQHLNNFSVLKLSFTLKSFVFLVFFGIPLSFRFCRQLVRGFLNLYFNLRLLPILMISLILLHVNLYTDVLIKHACIIVSEIHEANPCPTHNVYYAIRTLEAGQSQYLPCNNQENLNLQSGFRRPSTTSN